MFDLSSVRSVAVQYCTVLKKYFFTFNKKRIVTMRLTPSQIMDKTVLGGTVGANDDEGTRIIDYFCSFCTRSYVTEF